MCNHCRHLLPRTCIESSRVKFFSGPEGKINHSDTVSFLQHDTCIYSIYTSVESGSMTAWHHQMKVEGTCSLYSAYIYTVEPLLLSSHIRVMQCCTHVASSKAVVLNLCYSDVFGLQLPETPASTVGGECFWELQSKTPE